jgi:hypothetical protein
MANSHSGDSALREALILETADALRTEAARRGVGGLAISRASWLQGTDAVAGAVWLPVVGGQTVWRALQDPTDRLIVVEHPNYFGRPEQQTPEGPNVFPVQWWPSPSGPHPADATADGPHGDLEAARHLATGLRSIRGVRCPHGQPAAPWFVVSLPVSPDAVAAELAAAGFTECRIMARRFPEFPGGLHLQVAWPRRDNRAFLAVVRGVVEDLERK